MLSRMEKDFTVQISMCDNTGRLSTQAVFSSFMDLASEHGTEIGVGVDKLSHRDLFWLTVRTKVRIHRRPELMDRLKAITWPEAPNKVRCNRYYCLCDSEGIAIEGKSEWAVINTSTGRLCRLDEVYPADIEFCTDTVCDGPYERVPEDFEQCPELCRYTVRSTDIDIGQHMNNAVYLRVLMSAFSCEELEQMDIHSADVAFRTPCFEGDELSIRYRRTDDALDLAMLRTDGKLAFVARLL